MNEGDVPGEGAGSDARPTVGGEQFRKAFCAFPADFRDLKTLHTLYVGWFVGAVMRRDRSPIVVVRGGTGHRNRTAPLFACGVRFPAAYLAIR